MAIYKRLGHKFPTTRSSDPFVVLAFCYGPGRNRKENRTPGLQYRYIFTRTKDSYKNIRR